MEPQHQVPPSLPGRYERLISSISDFAIAMLDPDGFVASWNPGAEALEGYTSGEIIGQHFSKFFLPEDQVRSLPARALHAASTSGRFESEGWLVRKDGTRFWAESVLDAIRDESGEILGFAHVTRDVTQRKAAHDALKESEHQFRLLVEGVTDYAMYMLDPSGIITNWNPGAERLKGYTAQEIVGQHFSRFYTQEDRARGLPIRVLEAASKEGRFEAEGWRVRKDGSRFWAAVTVDAVRNEAGTLIGFAKITRDITERQAAQQALRESERQLRLLLNAVTDYALYMLDLNGIVSSWNSGAERIKGYKADEIIGQHFSRFYTEHERSAGLPARALETAGTEGRYEAEGWRVRKDGSLFWCHVIIDPVRDEDGQLIGFAKITRDVTERRNAELAKQKADLQQAYTQKMEALGQLTGGVAHDFNNLLMVITAQAQRLKKYAADDPTQLKALDSIEIAAKRGASLTRQLLSFSKRQVLSPVNVDLAAVFGEMGALLTSAAGPQVNYRALVPEDAWGVAVDKSEFELAILNLVINARDAMSSGGLLTISIENSVLTPTDPPAELTGEFVKITVSDTGCGIPEDVLPRVFDPFFTTKQRSNGTGLGLSQAFGFAQQSGGALVISTQLGQGTSVSIYLPRAHGTSGTSATEHSTTDVEAGRVLLVEDNPDVAEATATLLEGLGLTSIVAESAAAALDVLDDKNFDLLITDVVMPGEMDGLALAKEVRARQPDLAILVVTGYSQALSAASEFKVLRKPFGLAELARAINFVRAGAEPDNLLHFPHK